MMWDWIEALEDIVKYMDQIKATTFIEHPKAMNV